MKLGYNTQNEFFFQIYFEKKKIIKKLLGTIALHTSDKVGHLYLKKF